MKGGNEMEKQTYIQPQTEVVVLLTAPIQEIKQFPVHSGENDGDIETNKAFFDDELGDAFWDD